MWLISLRRGEIWTQIHTERRLELYGRKPRNYQKLGEKPETNPFLVSAKGTWPCQHFGFGLLVTRTVREYISVI